MEESTPFAKRIEIIAQLNANEAYRDFLNLKYDLFRKMAEDIAAELEDTNRTIGELSNELKKLV